VTNTSRGKPLVRIEPIRRQAVRAGYGAMRGTVELLAPEDQLIGSGDPAAWRTLEEWEEAILRDPADCQIAGNALQAGVPLATRDTRLIENADAVGLDVIEV
jgi:predicted nucleic acid-binding protein